MNRLLAIDRVSKFACVEFRGAAGRMNGADFLRGVINAFPGKIHTGLGDNGMAFANLTRNRNKPVHAFLGMPIFGRVCSERTASCLAAGAEKWVNALSWVGGEPATPPWRKASLRL